MGSLDIRRERGRNVGRHETHENSRREVADDGRHPNRSNSTRQHESSGPAEEDSCDHHFEPVRAIPRYAGLAISAANGRRHAAVHSKDASELFTNREYREVCKSVELKTRKTKRRRSEADSEPSSQKSAIATPAKSSGRRGSFDQPGSRDRPLDIDDDPPPVNLSVSKALIPDLNHTYDTRAKPAINLDKGMSEIEARFFKTRKLDKGGHGPRPSTESEVHSVRAPPGLINARHSPIQPSRTLEHLKKDPKRPGNHEPLPVTAQDDIRRNFKPERISPIEDDVDELHGPSTINKSPQRNDERSNRSLDEGAASRVREKSPSDLRPTQFRRSQQPGLHNSEITKDRRGDQISVEGVYSSMCNLDGEGIELVWNSHDKVFHVALNGSIQMQPKRNVPVTIGPTIKQWQSCSPDGLQVCLKGPAGQSSNGNLGIKFRNHVMRDECLKRLRPHEALEYDQGTLSDSNKQRVFEIIVRDARENARRRSQHNYVISGAIAKPWSRVPEKSLEDEEIKYEYEVEEANQGDQAEQVIPPRPKARDRMSGAAAAREATEKSALMPASTNPGLTTSKYFDQPRRTTRKSFQRESHRPRSLSPEKWTKVNNPPKWLHSVVYPPLPAMRRVTVDFTDLERLDEGEFLNDSVLSFALRRVEESMLPEHRKDVYMFNTFFYSSLSTKNGRKAFNYDAVKRWTSKVEIFKYRYVVVPINLDLHWFVAIICNLPKLMQSDDDSDIEEIQEITKVDFNQNDNEINGLPGPLPTSSPSPATHLSQLSLSDQDAESLKAQLGQQEVHSTPDHPPSSGKKPKKKRQGPPLKKYKLSEPVIMTLDSFGHSRSTEIKYLKDYIAAEALDKHSVTIDAKQRLQGLTVKGIPEQSNFCDCGVFVVGYIEEFAKDPRTFANKVLNRQICEDDFREFSPSLKRAELRDHLLELNKTQEEEHKARRREKKRNLANATTKSEIPSSSAGLGAADDKAASSPAKDSFPETTKQITSHEPAKVPAIAPDRSSPTTGQVVDPDDLVVSPPRPVAGKHGQQDHIPKRSPPSADHRPERTYADTDDEILINESPSSPARSSKVVNADGVQAVGFFKGTPL